MESRSKKRSRSKSPPPWRAQPKSPRYDSSQSRPHRKDDYQNRRGQDSFAQEQNRRNQANEDAQMREWVSKEDEFVLKQSKKKALIRVREGRAKPIDWIAIVLSVVDPTRDIIEEESAKVEIDIMNPEGVLERLNMQELGQMLEEVEKYLSLETNGSNRTYWNAVKTICKERRNQMQPSGPSARGVNSVTADVGKLLAPKTLDQLSVLEKQVNKKLQSNEPIDEDYWESLLSNIGAYKAKAELRSTYSSVVECKLKDFQAEQIQVTENARKDFKAAIIDVPQGMGGLEPANSDPEQMLMVSTGDKDLQILAEGRLLTKVNEERRRIQEMGYIPRRLGHQDEQSQSALDRTDHTTLKDSTSRFASMPNEDYSSATKALYDREVARGVQEDEEIFTGEEEVSTKAKEQWAGKYRPRKPRYFNRVQMGYEWNKYNQTHYDHDNPPPKVVQGYKFNIFYPDLIDKTKAPTYRIERENGRKRGQTFAPAGEEDTCLIRFISGPPYEDLAFRIVDKEWDYSAKHERGFRSSFDKGILQLHFQFKKVYYRK